MQLPNYSVRRRKDRNNLWYAYFRVPNPDPNLPPIQKQIVIPESDGYSKSKAYAEGETAIKDFLGLNKIQIAPVKASNKTPWAAAVEAWLSLEKGLLKEGTLRDARYGVLFYSSRTGVEYVEDMTQDKSDDAVREIQRLVRTGERQAHYWANARSRAKEFLDYARRKGMIAANYLQDTEAPKKGTFRKVAQLWTDEEFEATRNALRLPIYGKIMFLMRYTGMDLSDLATITSEHITKDAKEGWKLTKPRKKEERFSDAVIQLPINPVVEPMFLEAKERAADPTAPIFPELAAIAAKRNNNNLYHRIEVAWKRVYPGKRMKRPKDLRHTFATWCIVELKIPIDVVQEWLGHTPTSTVLKERYLHRSSTSEYAKRLAPFSPVLVSP